MGFPKIFGFGSKNASVAPQESAGATNGAEQERKKDQSQSAWDELKNIEYRGKQLRSEHDSLSNLDLETISQNLRTIKTPVDLLGKEQVFSKLDDKHSRRILSHMTGVGFDRYQSLNSSSVEQFLDQYPTPVEFADAENQLLDAIKEANSPEKYLTYCQDMARFKEQIYGERQDTYEQILDGARAIMILPKETEVEQSPETTNYRRLEKEESEFLLQNAEIDGDDYYFYEQSGRPQKERLTTDFLERCGLEPKYLVGLGGANIGLSDSYMIGTHQAITAYVQSDQGVKACSYYRSKSAGTWRYLPDYVGAKNDGTYGIGWFGKGRSEESLTLPSEMQVALEAISVREHADLDAFSSELAFVGTAKRYNSKSEYVERLYSGELRGSYYQEVAAKPILKFGELSAESKVPPETLDISGELTPDFSHTIGKNYKVSSSIFGSASAEHYQSGDGRLIYTFCQDSAGRAWLGGIESTTGKITSVGLRENWVEAGDLATPLYEYSRVSAGYGETSDAKGPYVSMWQNYLSRAPLIQKYLASKS